jgi:hypothetical protein
MVEEKLLQRARDLDARDPLADYRGLFVIGSDDRYHCLSRRELAWPAACGDGAQPGGLRRSQWGSV